MVRNRVDVQKREKSLSDLDDVRQALGDAVRFECRVIGQRPVRREKRSEGEKIDPLRGCVRIGTEPDIETFLDLEDPMLAAPPRQM